MYFYLNLLLVFVLLSLLSVVVVAFNKKLSAERGNALLGHVVLVAGELLAAGETWADGASLVDGELILNIQFTKKHKYSVID